MGSAQMRRGEGLEGRDGYCQQGQSAGQREELLVAVFVLSMLGLTEVADVWLMKAMPG